MQAENWPRVRALFDALVDQPAETWGSALDAQGVDDAQLRDEVLALLRADREDLVHTVIDAQAPEVLAGLSEHESDLANQRLSGRIVGAFRLIEEIGRGGMGTVWRAERIDGGFEQSVAIKLIRSAWDSSEMIGRFRAERQILANLNHPNIAHLVDGGVTDNALPWLALEFVDGTDLRSYCDEHQLGIEARLRLFQTVCAAVSHAHAHLVVHRDLKPSNLMVNRGGQVKLLDFGIAKLVDHGASHASLQRVFTPEYAAPEQVRGELVTTAVDVYALGLLLYELLTGRRPYKVKDSTPAAYERAILDQEPTRPSLAFDRDDDAKDLATRAAQREMSPQQMRRELRGDLDAIILKALRKQPEQRYASVADFAADIENHLQRRPVAARRGGWRYRASRFLRRHALASASIVLAMTALASGLLIALHQRDRARIEANKSERVLDFMVDNFQLADPGASEGVKISARELLDRGAKRITEELEEVPDARAQLLETMGKAYIGIGDFDQALEQFDAALQLRKALGDPLAIARTLVLKAVAYKNQMKNKESTALVDEARALMPQFPSSDKALAVESEILGLGAIHYFIDKDYTHALAEWSRRLDIEKKLYGSNDERTLDTRMMISRVLGSQGNKEGSIAMIRQVIDQLKTVQPERPSNLMEAYNALASAESKRERFDLAEAADRESGRLALQVYGPDHWFVAITLNNLGRDLKDQGRYEQAIVPMTEAVRIARAALAPTHGFLAAALKNLANAEFGAGRFAEAKRDYESVLDIIRQKPDTRDVSKEEITQKISDCDAALANAAK